MVPRNTIYGSLCLTMVSPHLQNHDVAGRKRAVDFFVARHGVARLSYKLSPFHRVVRDGWVQGGDIVSGSGDGGVSIYGDAFGDETFTIKFDEAGVLAMANDGPHTNGSQFLVTLAPQPWLDHKVVGFGR